MADGVVFCKVVAAAASAATVQSCFSNFSGGLFRTCICLVFPLYFPLENFFPAASSIRADRRVSRNGQR